MNDHAKKILIAFIEALETEEKLEACYGYSTIIKKDKIDLLIKFIKEYPSDAEELHQNVLIGGEINGL